jgi:hypothetical protein
MSSLTERMVRAARLDPSLYEEVENDREAMAQAMAVVVLASLAAGIGNVGAGGLGGIIVGTLGALLGWYVWAFLTYLIGTKLLPGPQTQADVGQLLRTTGFSSAPGVIRVLGVIPVLGMLAYVIAGIWMLVAMVIAVRQALDYEGNGRAVAVCLIGFVVQVVILGVVLAAFGGPSQPE